MIIYLTGKTERIIRHRDKSRERDEGHSRSGKGHGSSRRRRSRSRSHERSSRHDKEHSTNRRYSILEDITLLLVHVQ